MDTVAPAMLGFMVVAVIGILLMVLTRNSDDAIRVDVPEMILGVVLCGIVIFTTVNVGDKYGVDSKIDGYHQFLNGTVISAEMSSTSCSVNGSCHHTYTCNSHMVPVKVANSDGKGSHTEYHEEHDTCPYVTQEFNYWVTVSYSFKEQDFRVASHIFAANPQRWNGWEAEGSGIPGDVARGDPLEWTKVKARILAGDPPSGTGVSTYPNYILAADDVLLKQYSPDIDKFKAQNLLPPHTVNWNSDPLNGGWTAQKFQAIGGLRTDVSKWNDDLMQLNSALGVLRQGDMHVVALPASKVNSADSEAYVNALKAYWQSPEFGKWSLAKNGVLVVIGVSDNGQTIKWVNAKTGMPTGNGVMVETLKSTRDVPFNPDSFLGHPKAVIKTTKNGVKLSYSSSGGIVERITIFDPHTQFLRACMGCHDKNDNGTSYVYLKTQITVPHGVRVAEFFIVLVLCAGIWVGLYFFPLVSTIRDSGRGSNFPTNPFRRFRG